MPPGGEGAPFGKGSPFSPWTPLFPSKTFSPVRPDGPRRCLKARPSGTGQASRPPRQPDGRRCGVTSFSQQKGRHAWRPFLLALFRYAPNCRSVSPCPLPLIPKSSRSPLRPLAALLPCDRGTDARREPAGIGRAVTDPNKSFWEGWGELEGGRGPFVRQPKGPLPPSKYIHTAA